MPVALSNLANIKRDLTDALNTTITAEPRFISRFKNGADAKNIKHEWGQDHVTGRAITASAASSSGVLTVSAADAAKVKVGTLLTLKDDVALFKVTVIDGTSVTVDMVASNGSTLTDATIPSAGGSFNIVSTPIKIASENGDGEEEYRFNGTDWNATQIFRKEIIIPRTVAALETYGNIDNNIDRQTAFALQRIARDMNRALLFGRRVLSTDAVKGEMGGLYQFATGTGALSVNALAARLDSFVLNDAAQAITDQGCSPGVILCGAGQARVISNEYKDSIVITHGDRSRGEYVAEVVNEANGKTMTIISDPDMIDTHAWLLDDEGFYFNNFKKFTDEDVTEKGYDGQKRMALGEVTAEFRNAKQRCCLISNLKASATALAEIKAERGKTFVSNTTPIPVTAEVTNDADNAIPTTVQNSLTVTADADVPAAATNTGKMIIIGGTGWTEGTKIVTAVAGEIYMSNGTAWVKIG